jgi:hypothetical protein
MNPSFYIAIITHRFYIIHAVEKEFSKNTKKDTMTRPLPLPHCIPQQQAISQGDKNTLHSGWEKMQVPLFWTTCTSKPHQ